MGDFLYLNMYNHPNVVFEPSEETLLSKALQISHEQSQNYFRRILKCFNILLFTLHNVVWRKHFIFSLYLNSV